MSNSSKQAFRFCIVIEGHGQDKEEAWKRAVTSFTEAPGNPPPMLKDVECHDTAPGGPSQVEAGDEYTEDITDAFKEGRLG